MLGAELNNCPGTGRMASQPGGAMHSIKRHTMYNQYKNKMTKCFSLGRKASRVFWIPLSLANSCLTERARWQSLRRAHIKRNVNAKRKLQAASSNLLSADLLPREWRTIWAWPFLAGAANIHASDPKGKSQRQRLARYLELPCSHKAFRANKKGSQDESTKIGQLLAAAALIRPARTRDCPV